MKLADRIFKRTDYIMTSAFGYRKAIKTSAGSTDTFHRGTDYGTKGEKWGQYAVESGSIISCGIASDGAKYIWVKYPRIGKKLLHYHLDSIYVKKGQSVKKNTLLGYTGKTGKSTGIHLHLGMQDINGKVYQNPDIYDYKEEVKYTIGNYITLEKMNVRTKANTNSNIKKVKDLTADGKKNATSTKLTANAVYKKGTVFTALEIINKNGTWARTPSGYICIQGQSGKIYCIKKL